jgi:MoxR-like ATPase
LPTIERVVTVEELRRLGGLVPRIPVTDAALELAVRLARLSRPGAPDAPKEVGDYVRFGAGPRGSQGLVLAAKARAATRGEAAADIEDIEAMALPALRHRLVLSYRADVDNVSTADVVAAILRRTRA